MKSVICTKCGWVHFEVTRAHAEEEVARFNSYFDTLSEKEKQQYYGGSNSSIKNYEHCIRCGGSYKEFREALDIEIPFGSTVNPIIAKED